MAKQPIKKKLGTKVKAKTTNVYTWSGKNRNGNKVSGEMPGDSITIIKSELRKQGLSDIKVKKKVVSILDGLGGGVKPADIALISRQIATMLTAGVPLVQSLSMISSSSEKDKLRDLIGGIQADVETGTPLSEALSKYPEFFNELYCDLVDAGENSGALELIFDRIATFLEKTEALKSKIKKAMFYPSAVIAVAVIVCSILLLFVVPQFETIFTGFGAELPAFTQMIVGMSRWLQEWWYLLFGSIGLSFWFFFKTLKKSKKLQGSVDRFVLKVPIINPILHKAAVARFARTLSTTFAAGIPLIEALVNAAGASGNIVYKTAILSIRDETAAGMQMNVAMKTTGVFPDMVCQMVMIGEESGDLDSMLDKVADIYEREVDDAVDGLTSLLEPMIMVVLGVLIGGMVIGMYLPIFKLGDVV